MVLTLFQRLTLLNNSLNNDRTIQFSKWIAWQSVMTLQTMKHYDLHVSINISKNLQKYHIKAFDRYVHVMCLTWTDNVMCLTWTDNVMCLTRTDNVVCLTRTDNVMCLTGTDNVVCLTRTDNVMCLTRTDNVMCLTGTDNVVCLTRTDNVVCLTRTDKTRITMLDGCIKQVRRKQKVVSSH